MTPVLLQGAVWGYVALCDSSSLAMFWNFCVGRIHDVNICTVRSMKSYLTLV